MRARGETTTHDKDSVNDGGVGGRVVSLCAEGRAGQPLIAVQEKAEDLTDDRKLVLVNRDLEES